MKKLIMVTMIALTSLTSFGQDRVNRQKLSFEQSSEVLTNSTGWEYNETLGEWIDYTNVISKNKDFKDKYKSLQGSYMMSESPFKFNSLQIKTLTYNNTKYYVLLHDNWTGRYKYPSIRQDWKEYKRVDAYIFNETEYQNLKNFKNVTFSNVVKYDLEYEEYDETKLLDLIQTELSTPKSSYDIKYGSKWGMLITTSKDGNIRFLTPTILDLVIKYKTYDFTKMYFETNSDNFNKLVLK